MSKLVTFKTATQISIDELLVEFEAESRNGTCPYTQECDQRRRRLPTYREHQPCHWRVFWQWRDCPIYKNGGKAND
jgi:hypothetical protein